jgi:hypothetical protein
MSIRSLPKAVVVPLAGALVVGVADPAGADARRSERVETVTVSDNGTAVSCRVFMSVTYNDELDQARAEVYTAPVTGSTFCTEHVGASIVVTYRDVEGVERHASASGSVSNDFQDPDNIVIPVESGSGDVGSEYRAEFRVSFGYHVQPKGPWSLAAPK